MVTLFPVIVLQLQKERNIPHWTIHQKQADLTDYLGMLALVELFRDDSPVEFTEAAAVDVRLEAGESVVEAIGDHADAQLLELLDEVVDERHTVKYMLALLLVDALGSLDEALDYASIHVDESARLLRDVEVFSRLYVQLGTAEHEHQQFPNHPIWSTDRRRRYE